jgi:hypothetical protein
LAIHHERPIQVIINSHGHEDHFLYNLDVITKREERLLEFLTSGPKSLDEVTAQGIIYGSRSLDDGAWELSMTERIMMHKHLERLESLGTVTEENGRYHLV